MHGVIAHSKFTKAVWDLVNIIDGKSPLKDSLFEQAATFFEQFESNKARVQQLSAEVDKHKQTLLLNNKKDRKHGPGLLKKAKQALVDEQQRQENERLKRLQTVTLVCEKLIRLSENDTWEKTQNASARMLGTLYLLCPAEGRNVRQERQRYKPAYKAVLSVRLLDRLLADKRIKLEHIRQHHQSDKRYAKEGKSLTAFHTNVIIPLMIASIFQDIGLLHPKAQEIVNGEDGKNGEYQVLDNKARLELLKLNHEYTLQYITHGIGHTPYVGNSKSERDEHNAQQLQRKKLILGFLVGALNPKQGIGNVLKIPQIYTSFVFSSKTDQNVQDLPKLGLIITKTAERGSISKIAADCFLRIVGHFPQGYGVCYIPLKTDNRLANSYEYAVVTGLNPNNLFEPTCRAASKQLTFITNGQVLVVAARQNLYYPEPRKSLEMVDPERLKEILKKLASNYEERKDMPLVPSFWEPQLFFQYRDLQNLWKNS